MIYKPPTPCQIFFFFFYWGWSTDFFSPRINQYIVKETIINTDAVVFLINIWIGFICLLWQYLSDWATISIHSDYLTDLNDILYS